MRLKLSQQYKTDYQEIFLVPHSHFDLSWFGTPAECECINNNNIRLALDLLEENNGYRYSIETVRPLERYLITNPNEKERAERFIQKSHLEIGGIYVDVPCDYCFDESLVRNFYLGQRWLERTFGVRTSIVREEDVPGHFAQMPQVLVKCGIPFFKISRGPIGVFRWRAPDGSEVITALFEYNHSYHFQ